jgi:hypothetical protein
VCCVCVAARFGVFYSSSRIRKLWDLRNISVLQIAPTEFLITITIIVKFEESLVKCYIRSLDLYAAETWTLRKVDQKILNCGAGED